jgi:hypothetical protein
MCQQSGLHWSHERRTHTWSDAHSRIAVDASNPLSYFLRYAGDTLDLEFGITLGTPIADGLQHYVTLYSDCKAAIARKVQN